MADVWSRLSLYESTDLVKKLFDKRHKRELNTSGAQAIVSFFAQGREYFSSAAQAGELIRPLLQYYGVLTLVRGLILFRGPSPQEATLAKAHGLGAAKWEEVLAKGIEDVGNLNIRIEKGTFTQLVQVTQNKEHSYVYWGDSYGHTIWVSEGSTTFAPNNQVSLQKVLGCIPDLYDLYTDVFDEHPYCYKASIHTNGTDAIRIHILPIKSVLPDVSIIREQFYLPHDIDIVATNEYGKAGFEPTLNFQAPYTLPGGLRVASPPVQNNEEKQMFLVAPIGGNVRLSSLSTLYLASYALGMLARYYPRHWVALLTPQQGDKTFPLLKQTMNVIDRRVPQLVLQELEIG